MLTILMVICRFGRYFVVSNQTNFNVIYIIILRKLICFCFNRNKPTPPPPLPPHAVPLLPSVKVKQYKDIDDTEDYRPPVPPHRNIGVSTQNVLLEESPRRHHHHRHYHSGRDNKQRESKTELPKNETEVVDNMNSSQPLKNVFEFDDEPTGPSNTPINGVKMRLKNDKEFEEDAEFVEFPICENAEGNCKNLICNLKNLPK